MEAFSAVDNILVSERLGSRLLLQHTDCRTGFGKDLENLQGLSSEWLKRDLRMSWFSTSLASANRLSTGSPCAFQALRQANIPLDLLLPCRSPHYRQRR